MKTVFFFTIRTFSGPPKIKRVPLRPYIVNIDHADIVMIYDIVLHFVYFPIYFSVPIVRHKVPYAGNSIRYCEDLAYRLL